MDPTTNLPADMSIQDDLNALRSAAPSRIAAANDLDELGSVEAEVVGKRSPIATWRSSLGNAPESERKELGRAINDVAKELEALIGARRRELEGAAQVHLGQRPGEPADHARDGHGDYGTQ